MIPAFGEEPEAASRSDADQSNGFSIFPGDVATLREVSFRKPETENS
jgi:hypothetical protein